MPMYNIPIEERVTTLYQIDAPTAKAAEEAALQSHLSTEQPGLVGADVHGRDVGPAERSS